MPLALEGMKIVDCSQVLAGPFCTMLLADMGADIIKIEKPAGGDDTRHMGPPFVSGESAAFLAMNRNKRSVVLDFKQKGGLEAAKRLASDADVMIENNRTGTMDRLGLGYEEMSAANPALVYCSISGFGRTGPYSKRAGYDLIAQGMSGLMSITGMPDSPPVKVGVPMADLNAGMFAAYGILSAYIHRLKTGEGQYLEVSLLESALAYMVWESGIYFTTGDVSRPLGSAHRLSAPYQSLKTRDGYINVGAPNDTNWERLAHTMGRVDLLEDDRFTDNAGRMANRSDLEVELEQHVDGARHRRLAGEVRSRRIPRRSRARHGAGVEQRAGPGPEHGCRTRAPGCWSGTPHRLGGEAVRHTRPDGPASPDYGSTYRRGVGRGRLLRGGNRRAQIVGRRRLRRQPN